MCKWIQASVGITAATVLLSLSVAQAASAPTLGVGSRAEGRRVRPGEAAEDRLGGDATSFVSNVKWRSWGGSRAIGHGSAVWVWPGWCVACGGVRLPATVVAFGKTICQGHSAYAYVEWFLPSRGMSFDRRLAGDSLCAGSTPSPHPGRSCNAARSRCLAASAPSTSTCSTRRSAVQPLGSSCWFRRGGLPGRMRVTASTAGGAARAQHGFRRAPELTCTRGDFANVNFELKPA